MPQLIPPDWDQEIVIAYPRLEVMIAAAREYEGGRRGPAITILVDDLLAGGAQWSDISSLLFNLYEVADYVVKSMSQTYPPEVVALAMHALYEESSAAREAYHELHARLGDAATLLLDRARGVAAKMNAEAAGQHLYWVILEEEVAHGQTVQGAHRNDGSQPAYR